MAPPKAHPGDTINRHIYSFLARLKDFERRITQHIIDERFPVDLLSELRNFVEDSVRFNQKHKAILPDPSREPLPRELNYDWNNVAFQFSGDFFYDMNAFEKAVENLNGIINKARQSYPPGLKELYRPLDMSRFNASLLISWENMKRIKHLNFYLRFDEECGRIDMNGLVAFLHWKEFKEGTKMMTREDCTPGLWKGNEAIAMQSFRFKLCNKTTPGTAMSLLTGERSLADTNAKLFPGLPDQDAFIEADVTTPAARHAILESLSANKDRRLTLKEACEKHKPAFPTGIRP